MTTTRPGYRSFATRELSWSLWLNVVLRVALFISLGLTALQIGLCTFPLFIVAIAVTVSAIKKGRERT